MRLLAAAFCTLLLTAVHPVTPVRGAATFSCSRILGFSQTRQWAIDSPVFQQIVGDAQWEFLGSGDISSWANPSFSGWNNQPLSPCAAGDPDRVVLTISGAIKTPWVQKITEAVATIRSKYPQVESIVLQPVVGGPDDGLCFFQGSQIRASVNNPVITDAITDVVAADSGNVIAGPDPEVQNCSMYRDRTGHLRVPQGQDYIGQILGNYYAP